MLWLLSADPNLSSTARAAIVEAEPPALASAVNVWEVASKRRLGKLDAPPDLLDRLEGAGIEVLAVTGRHADEVGRLPLHHRDPFDRLLIAQAQVDRLAVVSGDPIFGAYDPPTVW